MRGIPQTQSPQNRSEHFFRGKIRRDDLDSVAAPSMPSGKPSAHAAQDFGRHGVARIPTNLLPQKGDLQRRLEAEENVWPENFLFPTGKGLKEFLVIEGCGIGGMHTQM
jgi:hypothetical protein